MIFRPLPPEVLTLLERHQASPRLIAHLTIVHDVALTLIREFDACWPTLVYDREGVLMGAATHDIGKTVYTKELSGSGNLHEEIGPQMLLADGFPEKYTRFARTHGRWQQEAVIRLEDVLVAFADKIWKGKRDEALEQEIVSLIASACQLEPWSVYLKLDDIASDIAKDAHERILWQGNHTI